MNYTDEPELLPENVAEAQSLINQKSASSIIRDWLLDKPIGFRFSAAEVKAETGLGDAYSPTISKLLKRGVLSAQLIPGMPGYDYRLERPITEVKIREKKPMPRKDIGTKRGPRKIPTAAEVRNELRDKLLEVAARIEALGRMKPSLAEFSTEELANEIARRVKAG